MAEDVVRGLCTACGIGLVVAHDAVTGERLFVERPPQPGGDLLLRFDRTPIEAFVKGAVIDLGDPFDDGSRWRRHVCPFPHADGGAW